VGGVPKGRIKYRYILQGVNSLGFQMTVSKWVGQRMWVEAERPKSKAANRIVAVNEGGENKL